MPKFDEYIVAYIDILGTSEKIRNDVDNSHLELFKSIYDETNKYIKLINDFSRGRISHPQVNFKIFSDNIIVFAKCSSTIIHDMDNIASWVLAFQAKALINGLLTRGAITQGEFYHDENFVYGKALLEAVKLEENSAIYPRVIYDPKNIKYNPINGSLDNDGLYFIDYISSLWRYVSDDLVCSDECTQKKLLKIRELLLSLHQKEVNGNIKIFQKYQWLINKYNVYCKELEIGEPHLEKIMSFEGFYITSDDLSSSTIAPYNLSTKRYVYPIERIE